LLKQSPIDGVQPVMRDINLANRAIVRRYGKIALSVLARAASTYPSWLRTATKSSKISSMKRSG
jgi:hypothetical protein